MRKSWLVAALLVSALPLGAQTGAIAGLLISRETGQPLAYGVIALPLLNRERFTTENGEFLFGEVPTGPTRVRVRRLGYMPTEVTVNVRANATDTIRVELAHVAVRLSTVDVRAFPRCLNPGPPRADSDSTLATVFDQLMLNAQQFELLSRSYPFSYLLVAKLSHVDKDGHRWQDDVDSVRIISNETWKYRPGELVGWSSTGRRFGNRVFRVPTLLNFADPDFVRSHCFYYGGLMDGNRSQLVRIYAMAAEGIKDPDVNATILLDPQTFQIRASILKLSRLPAVVGMTDLEVTTEFYELLPSIAVIGRIVSRQDFDRRVRGIPHLASLEDQQMSDLMWLGAKPGEERKPEERF